MAVKVTKPEINVREKISDLDKPTGTAGLDILRAETPQEVFNYIGAGRRNLLHNGAMMINQRGTQSGITSSQYTLDRWQLGDGTGGTFQVSQSENIPDGFQNALLFETTTADTSLSGGTQYLNITQKLEGQDIKQLAYGTPNAKPVTLSFWVKSSKAGQFASELEIPGSKVNVQTWRVNQADTWEYKTVTFEGNASTAITTTTSVGMWVVLCWMAAGDGISGPNFQPGWRTLNQTERLPEGIPNMADSTNNIMRFTGVQLELGKVATPFEHRTFNEELLAAYRYYQTHTVLGSGTWNGPSSFFCAVDSPVPMRQVPVIRTQSGVWSNINIEYDDSYNVTGGSVQHGSVQGSNAVSDLSKFIVTLSTSGSQTTGYGGVPVCDRNNDWFIFDSEL